MEQMELVDNVEHRYAEEGGRFKLQSWASGSASKTNSGPMSQRPEWLVRIADVARVANAFEHTTHPPPQAILWFRTDKNLNLLGLMRTSSDYQITASTDL